MFEKFKEKLSTKAKEVVQEMADEKIYDLESAIEFGITLGAVSGLMRLWRGLHKKRKQPAVIYILREKSEETE